MKETEDLGGGRARAAAPIRLDILAKQIAGTERKGAVEAMLAANPGLAAGGAYVAEGRIVAAPKRPAAESEIATINPWE